MKKIRYIGMAVIIIIFLYFFINAVIIQAQKLAETSEGSLPRRVLEVHKASEENLNEEFKLRYYFFDARGLFHKVLGRRQVDNSILLDNGHLVSVHFKKELGPSLEGMKAFRDKCEENDTELMYVNIPTALIDPADVDEFGLTSYANSDADEFLKLLDQENISNINMRKCIEEHYEDPYDAFFKTDHHWKISTGLFCAQTLTDAIIERHGIELDKDAVTDDKFSIQYVEDCWLGEYGRRTGSLYNGLEDFELIKPIGETSFRLIIPSRNMDEEGDFSIMLHDEDNVSRPPWYKAEELYTNSFYYKYLYGNDPIQTIINNNQKNGKILVIKDSFSQSVIPFLALTANTVVSYDPRYNDGGLTELIEQNDFDMVIVCYTESMLDRHSDDKFMFDFS